MEPLQEHDEHPDPVAGSRMEIFILTGDVEAPPQVPPKLTTSEGAWGVEGEVVGLNLKGPSI
eukprot:2117037-Prorocentrum_lima.AAC.1